MSVNNEFYCAEHCFHYKACLYNSEYTPSPCSHFKDKADVVEVRHGYWVWKFNLDDDDFFECSICGRQEVINGLCRERNPVEHFPYCNCGAKMDGERKEE